MSKKIVLVAMLLPALIIISISTACQPSTPPAKFAVTSLDISPTEVAVGETANIRTEVTNNGGTGAVYGVTLYVDGKKINTKYVNLDPGFTQSVIFPLSEDEAGTYKIAVGERSATLSVKSKLVAKQVEIENENGMAKDYLSLVKPSTGYTVNFKSPASLFIIRKVRVFGLVYGSPGFHIENSQLHIWDADQKVLYNTSFSGDQFPLRTRLGANIDSTGAWVDIDIPDVKVDGDFYVHIYTGIPTGQGFRMGAVDMPNTHSDTSIRGDDGVDYLAPDWPYMPVYWYGDRSRVNWMIRVAGNAMVPQE